MVLEALFLRRFKSSVEMSRIMSELCANNQVQIVGRNFPYFEKQIWSFSIDNVLTWWKWTDVFMQHWNIPDWSYGPFSLFSHSCSSSSSPSSFISSISCVFVSLSHFCITWWIQFSNVVQKGLIISIIPNLQPSNFHSNSLLTHWNTVVRHLARSIIPLSLNRNKAGYTARQSRTVGQGQ